MVTCDSCGRVNDESAHICSFCGAVLTRRQRQATTGARDYAPPRAGRATVASGPQAVEPYTPPSASIGYRCPNCGSTYPPIAEKRISAQGWIVFVTLLVVCLPLFWIGMLMKEEIRVCPMCRAHLV